VKKVLVLGESPLPIENSRILTGPGIRTWQFAKPLLDNGHKVSLISFATPGAYMGKEKVNKTTARNFMHHSVNQKDMMDLTYFQKIHDSFKPDCILSISSYRPMYLATQLKFTKPIWFDQGDLMAEAQIKSFVDNSDGCLYDFLKIEKMVLGRGDIFSTVSTPQKFALIGRLGENGRLNKDTVGYEFVHVIPCGIEKSGPVHKKTIIRGKYVKKDDFVILWSGGYNNWADIDTLYLALEKAMAKSERIKFVSSGGPIDGQSEVLYSRFIGLINKSRFKDRYIMLGWIPTKDLANLYLESQLGINIDKNCYEVLLGSRHRLLDWMRVGLVALTTNTSELTRLLSEKRTVFTFPVNDSNMLAETMLDLASNTAKLKEYGERGKDFVYKNLSNEKVLKPFLEWVDNVKHSPDISVKIKKGHLDYNGKYLGNLEQDYIRTLKEQIDNKEAENKNLYNELNVKEIGLTNLKNHAANLEKEREGLKSHIKNLESIHDRFKSQTENLNLHSANLQKQVQDLVNERDNLKWRSKDLEMGLTNLKNHTVNLEGEREGLKAHIKTLESERNNLNLYTSNLQNMTQALEVELANIKNHIINLEGERASQKAHIANLEAERASQKAHISNLEAERASQKAHIFNLENEISNLTNGLNKIYSTKAYKIYKVFRKVKCLKIWRKK